MTSFNTEGGFGSATARTVETTAPSELHDDGRDVAAELARLDSQAKQQLERINANDKLDAATKQVQAQRLAASVALQRVQYSALQAQRLTQQPTTASYPLWFNRFSQKGEAV